MTAIAYKDKILATDSLISEGDIHFCNTYEKVRVVETRHGIYLIAMAGAVNSFTALADTIEEFILSKGRKEGLTEQEFDARCSKEFIEFSTSNPCSVFVVKPSGNFSSFSKEGFEGHYSKDVPIAIGQANHYLYGAMDHGSSATMAVSLACKRFGHCGGEVRVYRAGKGPANAAIRND